MPTKTMIYRKRKLPFTGSIIADGLIGLIAAYALVAVILTLFGRPLARYSPGILTYFSFQDGMGWNYTFYEGSVGPFHIGQGENETRDALVKCECFTINPRKPQTPGVRVGGASPKILDELMSSGSLLASKIEAGSFVSYELSFNNKKLFKVNAYSYLLGDL